MEQDLTSKLDATLEPLVGAGPLPRFGLRRNRFDQRRAERREFRSHAVRHGEFADDRRHFYADSRHRRYSGNGFESAGCGSAPAVTGGGTSRKTESVNYQTSRTVKRTVLAAGLHQAAVRVRAHRSRSTLGGHRRQCEARSGAAVAGTDEGDSRPGGRHRRIQHGARRSVDSSRALPFESTLNLDPPLTALPAAGANPSQRSPIEQLKSQSETAGDCAEQWWSCCSLDAGSCSRG